MKLCLATMTMLLLWQCQITVRSGSRFRLKGMMTETYPPQWSDRIGARPSWAIVIDGSRLSYKTQFIHSNLDIIVASSRGKSTPFTENGSHVNSFAM